MQQIYIKMGDAMVGNKENTLVTVLGSCVGIIAVWKKKEIVGLAHCILPEATGLEDEKKLKMKARYVTNGIQSLIKLMDIKKNSFKEIEVTLAGGANIYKQVSSISVGDRNVEVAIKEIRALGFRLISSCETGGNLGRRVKVNCENYDVSITEFDNVQG